MKKLYIYIFICCTCWGLVKSQSPSTSDADMVVIAHADYSSINVSWYPLNPKTWKQLLEIGYRLERVELNEAGEPVGETEVLSNNILPQNQEWFQANQDPKEFLIEPIGSLLYDEDFNFEARDGLDETEMKFNYIVYEAQSNPLIAFATGLGFTDTAAEPGKTYRYTVKASNGAVTGSVDIFASLLEYRQNPLISPHEFIFPGGLSLSAMYYQNRKIENTKIVGLARAYEDSIVIRWVPPNNTVWELAKEDGFKIYRTDGRGDPDLIAEVKQWPKSAMDSTLWEQDSIAFLAAGILYGAFDLSQVTSINDRYNTANNFYTMAMMAAEQSSLAADILGFRYVDKNVEADSNYTYLISTQRMLELSDVGMINVKNTYIPESPPSVFYLTPADKSIRLNWSRDLNIHRFSYYKVERSQDGEHFEQINEAPIVFMDTDVADFTEYFYVDSVGVNDVPFYYRLSGGNSFGEWSLPAEGEGKAVDLTPPPAAEISLVDYQDSLERFVIQWVQPNGLPDDFAYAQVMMSKVREGFYTAISEPLGASIDSFYFDIQELGLEGRYFFKIASEDQNGNRRASEAFPARVPDITPPDIPVNIAGIIDSLGKVKISWDHSLAEDRRGYWLYWSNDPEDQMSLVSQEIITTNEYFWSVNAKSLNKEIYFCLRAEDHAFNRSNPSEILTLDRPDHVPPIPPIMKPVSVSDRGLTINWKVSVSDDVAYSLLYKRSTIRKDTNWVLLDTIRSDTGTYLDTLVKIDRAYQYKIRSVDDAGNPSDFSALSQGVLPFPAEQEIVFDLQVTAEEGNKLSWNYLGENPLLRGQEYQYDIYRSTGSGGLKKLQSVPAETLTYIDQDIIRNVLYNYAIRLRFKNGWLGNLSPTQSIIIR